MGNWQLYPQALQEMGRVCRPSTKHYSAKHSVHCSMQPRPRVTIKPQIFDYTQSADLVHIKKVKPVGVVDSVQGAAMSQLSYKNCR
jgi:ubiquinone/menaquinone biosynthesis C-methylase UbiE